LNRRVSARPTLPSDHRAKHASWIVAAALGAIAGPWMWFYSADHPHMHGRERLQIGAFVLAAVAIWMAIVWWKFVRMRVRLEDDRLVFTAGGPPLVVTWSDISSVTTQHGKYGLVGLVLATPRGAIKLPKELRAFDTIVAELEARVPSERWVRTSTPTLMHR
jgi:hypothetical protein